MRYDMELCDELPMLILIACGCVQVSDIHPLGRKHRWHGVAAIDAAIVGFMSAVAAVYIVTRTYSHFTTGFTLGAVALTGILVTADFKPAYRLVGYRAVLFITVAKCFWEVEQRFCAVEPRVWVLHNVWHLLSSLAANDCFLAGYLYRIDKLGADGIHGCLFDPR